MTGLQTQLLVVLIFAFGFYIAYKEIKEGFDSFGKYLEEKSKKRESKMENNKSSNSDVLFCSNCGKAYFPNEEIKYCAECGNKL